MHAVGHVDAEVAAGPRSTASHSRRSSTTLASGDHSSTIAALA